MSKKKEVKVGIIGTSKRGLTQVKNSKLVKEFKLTAVCDKYDALVKNAYDLADDSSISCYTDHRKMLREADIEAVFIVVEPENNADIVCEALEAGKHVLCEVPLALTIEDCWKIVHAVEKSGLKFQMAEQARYSAFAQAWVNMVSDGKLGKILFVEGQYIHPLTDNRFYVDSKTGKMLTIEEAKNNPKAVKSRVWKLGNPVLHPILYLPHELSPFLRILDDRVKKVSCMATRPKSYRFEWFPESDIEVALMHTEKDTLMRLVMANTIPNYRTKETGYHWYHMMGTGGRVETKRSNNEKMKMWLADSYMSDPAEVKWEYTEHDTPKEALQSGHGGKDFYPIHYFVRSILDDTQPPLNVYKSADTAAPAIVAGKSAEMGGKLMEVPDFRPGKNRKYGQLPENNS